MVVSGKAQAASHGPRGRPRMLASSFTARAIYMVHALGPSSMFNWAAGVPVLKGAIRVGAHAHYRPGRGGQTVLCGTDEYS